jgi:putative ABC transport system substrate-binding protein
MVFDETDPEGKARLSAFTQGLAELGWTDVRLRMDVRLTAQRRSGAHLCERIGRPATRRDPRTRDSADRCIPAGDADDSDRIVNVADPVGVGFVAGLDQPGGNATGFINIEAGMGGKWLQLFTEVAPGVKRAAAIFNPDAGRGSYYLPAFEAAARSLKVEPITASVHRGAEIETAITSLGREPRGGLVVIPDGFYASPSHANHIAGSAKQCTGGLFGICLC